MKKEWTLNLEYWNETNPETLKYVLQEAQLNLDHTLAENDKLTARAFTLVSIIIPVLSLAIGYMVKDMANTLEERHALLEFLSLIAMSVLSYVLFLLIKIIVPRNIMYSGREPKELVTVDNLQSNELSHSDLYISMLISEVEWFQARIEHNDYQNELRIEKLNTAINAISITIACLIAAIFLTSLITILT